jgi:hypothetical protein
LSAGITSMYGTIRRGSIGHGPSQRKDGIRHSEEFCLAASVTSARRRTLKIPPRTARSARVLRHSRNLWLPSTAAEPIQPASGNAHCTSIRSGDSGQRQAPQVVLPPPPQPTLCPLSIASAERVAPRRSHEVTCMPGACRRAARPNPSLKARTRYGSHRLAAPGHVGYRPSAASRRPPPRSA